MRAAVSLFFLFPLISQGNVSITVFALIGSPLQLLFLLILAFPGAVVVAVNKKFAPNAELRRGHAVFSQATSTLSTELAALRGSVASDTLASQAYAHRAAAFAKNLSALRSVAAPAYPSDYRDGYNVCVAYADQLRDFLRDKAIAYAQTSPTETFSQAEFDDFAPRLAEFNALTNRLSALAGRYVR